MTRGGPNRRELLTGGLGLLVGAGAAAGVTLSLDGGADTGPNVPSPGEELMVEHGVLKRILLAYQAAHDALTAGHSVPAEAILDAATIVGDYVESFHEGLEEAYVFPRVAAREPELVRTLVIQHDRGRHLTKRINEVAAAPLGTAGRRQLVADLAAFTRMYAPHEAWEDTVVYPALRASCTQRTLDELAERFADLQNAQYGDHALSTMLQRVAGIEQQLGIGELAAFTPPSD